MDLLQLVFPDSTAWNGVISWRNSCTVTCCQSEVTASHSSPLFGGFIFNNPYAIVFHKFSIVLKSGPRQQFNILSGKTNPRCAGSDDMEYCLAGRQSFHQEVVELMATRRFSLYITTWTNQSHGASYMTQAIVVCLFSVSLAWMAWFDSHDSTLLKYPTAWSVSFGTFQILWIFLCGLSAFIMPIISHLLSSYTHFLSMFCWKTTHANRITSND